MLNLKEQDEETLSTNNIVTFIRKYIGEELMVIIVIICLVILFAMPIAATVIYFKFSGDLDKCDVDFKTWMLTFIILEFVFIPCTIIAKFCCDKKKYDFIVLWSGLGMIALWITACVFLAKANKTHICKEVSLHVYNFVISVVFIPPAFAVLIIVVFIIGCFCLCICLCLPHESSADLSVDDSSVESTVDLSVDLSVNNDLSNDKSDD